MEKLGPTVYRFEVYHSPELSAGLWGYTEEVKVELQSGCPMGEPGEFENYLRHCLKEWFDGAQVELLGENQISAIFGINEDLPPYHIEED